MKSDMLLDYAVFQLSPKRSRCELFVLGDGKMEKLASGLVKPFVTHLKVAEEQVGLSVQSIKLEVEKQRNAHTWFTKGTLERFVLFVSTPDILELVNIFDAEMTQLEAAQRLYSQGAGDQLSGAGGVGSGIAAASDATKKELLRAIDVRLDAVKQDLTMACSRAAAAGFNLDTVLELQMFADQFGASRLNEACSKFISLCERRLALTNPWKGGRDDHPVRSSYGSDMSIDEDPTTPEQLPAVSYQHRHSHHVSHMEESAQPSPTQQSKPSSISFSLCPRKESSPEKEDTRKDTEAFDGKDKKGESSSDQVESTKASRHVRRLSVQDRINLFENKRKESSGSGGKPVVGKSVELRRQSSDVPEKAVLRRWSGASDMSIDLSGERRKDAESPLSTPLSASAAQAKSEDQKVLNLRDSASSGKLERRSVPGRVVESGLKDQAEIQSAVGFASGREEVVREKVSFSFSNSRDANEAGKSNSNLWGVDSDGWKHQICGKTQSKSLIGQTEDDMDLADSGAPFRPLSSGKIEMPNFSNQGKFKGPYSANELGSSRGRVNSKTQLLKDQGTAQTQFQAFASKTDDTRLDIDSPQAMRLESLNKKEELELGDKLPSHSYGREPQRSAIDPEHSEGGPVSSLEDSIPLKMKFEKQVSDPVQVKKVLACRDVNSSVYGNGKTLFSGNIVPQPPQNSDSSSTPLSSQVQRQAKGNRELNDQLKTKANELEKLFAEHKLRIPGDSSYNRRNGAADMQSESSVNFSYQKSIADSASAQWFDSSRLNESAGCSDYMANSGASPLLKTVENQNYEHALSNNFSELGFSGGLRGKFYDRYIQKRNEKLAGEWSSRQADKEAKLKAMQDSFECSRAEMKAKFSGSADRQDSVSTAHRRAERLRSFNTRSYMGREQPYLDFGQSDYNEDLAGNQKQKILGKDKSCNDTCLGMIILGVQLLRSFYLLEVCLHAPLEPQQHQFQGLLLRLPILVLGGGNRSLKTLLHSLSLISVN